jgi:hypothetical protein
MTTSLLAQPRRAKLTRQLRIKGVLARLIELVDGASLAKLFRKFRHGLGRGLRFGQERRRLGRGNGADIRTLGLAREAQHLRHRFELRGFKAGLRNIPAARQCQNGKDVDGDLALDLECVSSC